MINETLSFDSTIESPIKPHQENPSPQNKAIFLVHYMKEKQKPNKNSKKIDNENSKQKKGPSSKTNEKVKTFQNTMLDFDILLSTFFQNEQKDNNTLFRKKKSLKKNGKKKIYYLKRRKHLKEIKNKSNYILF